MSGAEVGILSVVLILVLIYCGLYVPVALGVVSFIGVWIVRGNLDVPINLLAQATAHTVDHFIFGVIPLFVLMGLLVSQAGLGRDIYDFANLVFRFVRGGLGIATVAANAVFAAITGTTIASASVFTRVSLPEMRRYGYEGRFAVGVVAGSSVLGMLIPPSVMLILYAVITEQSIGDMFLAGVFPGILLSIAYILLIIGMAYLTPGWIGRQAVSADPAARSPDPDGSGESESTVAFVRELAAATIKMVPPVLLILVVLGGIYGIFPIKFTPTEAGAVGALLALVITMVKRRLTWSALWDLLVETGHITASILFLIISASMYSRMLGVTGIPTELGRLDPGARFRPLRNPCALCRPAPDDGNDPRHGVHYSDHRAALPAGPRTLRHQPDLVRHHHRPRRGDRPLDAAARHRLFCHQEHHR